jgi:hypothetical protein
MTVSEHQLQLDIDAAIVRLVDQLRDRRRVTTGAQRLLVDLIRAGLDVQHLPVAAALVTELDRPRAT